MAKPEKKAQTINKEPVLMQLFLATTAIIIVIKNRTDKKRTPWSGHGEHFPSLPVRSLDFHFTFSITTNWTGSPIRRAPGTMQMGLVLLGNMVHMRCAIVPNLINEVITLTGHSAPPQHLVTNPCQELPIRALIPRTLLSQPCQVIVYEKMNVYNNTG